MKGKSPVRDMADMHISSVKHEDYADNKNEFLKAREDEELPDFELELEIDDEAQVQSIDGVIIEGNDEVARLLFYHYKPKGLDVEEELVRCRCIAELRVSRSKLREIVKELKNNIKEKKKRRNDLKEKLPMYN